MAVISGSNQTDALHGTTNNDAIYGYDGIDWLWGEDGNDWLDGGEGYDRALGGNGVDTASYASSRTGVKADLLNTFNVTPTDDYLVEIENVWGSAYDDSLSGDDGENTLTGAAGDDYLSGRGGQDVLSGGSGEDRLFGGSDQDELSGGPNDDLLDGGSGGDVLDGGSGSDTAYYRFSNAAVTIDLTADTASGGYAVGDELNSIENVVGSYYDDNIIGNSGSNRLVGDPGDDDLDGRGGADTIIGGRGSDDLTGGGGHDTFEFDLNETGYDTIHDFEAGFDSNDVVVLANSGFNDLGDVLNASVEYNGDTVIEINNNTSITLAGVRMNDLHADDFGFV